MLEDQIPSVARSDAVFAITLEPESGVQVPPDRFIWSVRHNSRRRSN